MTCLFKHRREAYIQLQPIGNSALEGFDSQHHSPAILVQERPDTHCAGGWVGLGRFLYGAENLIPLGFDPRTLRPIASRYTDCAMGYNCVI